MTHLTQGVKFTSVAHQVSSADNMWTGSTLLVVVTGRLKVDGGENALNFSQTFNLCPCDAQGKAWYIKHDIFRLVYA